MKSECAILLLVISLSGCKKEQESPGIPDVSYEITTVPPEEISLSVTINGITRVYSEGVNGYSLIDGSTFGVNGQDLYVIPSVSFDYTQAPGTSFSGNTSLSLPSRVGPLSDWNENASLAFLHYFDGTYYAINGNNPSFHLVTENADWWIYDGGEISGELMHCYEIESYEFPSKIRIYGYLSVPVINPISNETTMASVIYTLRFQEPS